MPIPYNLRVSEEEQDLREADPTERYRSMFTSPRTRCSAAAIFTILTRLKESKKQGMDLVKKMRLYDGEAVEGFKESDVEGTAGRVSWMRG